MLTLIFLAACSNKHNVAAPAPKAAAPAVVAASPPEPAAPPLPAAQPAPVLQSPGAPPQITAVARLRPQNGGTVSGAVAFSQAGEHVNVSINLLGATPGEHFVRVHGGGTCAANPHGDEVDLGRLMVLQGGYGHADLVLRNTALAEGDESMLGRPVVVDDGKACGLIDMPS